MDVLWLGDPACEDLLLVGGKAANLSRLAARHRVPPGFCLTTAAFERARGGAGRRALAPPPHADARERLRGAGRAGRNRSAERGGALLGGRRGRRRASFAGQHETYLNVVGAEADLPTRSCAAGPRPAPSARWSTAASTAWPTSGARLAGTGPAADPWPTSRGSSSAPTR